MATPVNTTEIKESNQSKIGYEQLGGLKTPQAKTTKVEMPKDAPSEAVKASDNLAQGTAQGVTADERDMAEGADAAGQMNKITAEDSPMMRQARQEGMLASAKRGLGNSSIAAGAAQASATKAAAPLALQNSVHAQQQAVENQRAANRANEVTATEANKMEATNVSEANKLTSIDAIEQNKMISQHDQEMFDAAVTNATETNKAALLKFSGDQEIMQTWMSGEISQTMAHLSGQYNQVITQNQTAAQIYSSTLDTLADLWANKDIPLSVKNGLADSAMTFMEGALKVTGSITNITFTSDMPST